MSKQFKGCYEITYAGGAPPQYFMVDADDLEDDMTDEDIAALYDAQAIEAFYNDITCFTQDGDKFLAWAREQLAARKRAMVGKVTEQKGTA